jgi:hypothetical protein
MALEGRNWRTLEEIVCSISEEGLIEFARARAQREADSCAYEGIELDADALFRAYLNLYRKWRTEVARQQGGRSTGGMSESAKSL